MKISETFKLKVNSQLALESLKKNPPNPTQACCNTSNRSEDFSQKEFIFPK